MTADTHIDWRDWLRRWDAQQESYIVDREAHFAMMFDALEVLLPESFTALDLGCGPGSLSARLLARFPKARVIAIDMDPLLLAIGQGALGTMDGRLRWVRADLSARDWFEALGETQVDAALSTTALFWLGSNELVNLYRDLGRLVRPGGVLLNGDTNMAFGPELPTFRRLAQHAKEQCLGPGLASRKGETWEDWWEAVAREPSLAPIVAERWKLFAAKPESRPIVFDLHVAALRDAGFQEVGTLWKTLLNTGLLAIR